MADKRFSLGLKYQEATMRRPDPKILVLRGEVMRRPSKIDSQSTLTSRAITASRFNSETDKMRLHIFIYDFLLQGLRSPAPKLLSLCGPELEGHHALWMEALLRHGKKDSVPTFIERSSKIIQECNLIDKAVKCKATLVEGSAEDCLSEFNCLDLDYCQNFKSISKVLFPALKRTTLPSELTVHITGGYRGRGNGRVTGEECENILHNLDRLMRSKIYRKGYVWEEPTQEKLVKEGSSGKGQHGATMRCILRSYHKDYNRMAREIF
jgi:hypothetical protein